LELALHRVDKNAIYCRKNIPPSTPDADSGIIEFTLARAEVLLRLMQHVENETDQKSIKDFVYYFGLLRKDAEFIISDAGMHQNRAQRIMSDADQMLANKAAKSSESTHTNPILVLLDDIFKNPDLVKEAEELLKGESDDEIDIKLCELLRLPSRNLSKEDYVKEENRLRDELGKAFQKRTGCTLNFGQGLSLEDLCIRVIIIMNYATKECEGYTGGLDWLDLMDLDNGCIHLWYKGLVTLSTITAGGPRPTYTKGVYSTRGIAFTDRVNMIPEQKDGYEDLFTNFCKEVRSTKRKMHLVNAIFLALKVNFLNMNDIIPAVLGTGAPVRDHLLNNNTDVRITPRVISLGWLVHSQKIMNKGGMLLQYSEEEIQDFSNTVTRAYALLDPSVPVAANYPDIIGMFCELYKLTEEQRAAIREARRQHGFASGKMRTEAAEIYAFLLEDGLSSKEAMEWILSELSEAHYNLYDACLRVGKMRTDAKEMYHKLVDTKKLSREQALDRIEKKLSVKHRNMYEASLKVGDMKTEAKEMYHELMKEENMTREIALVRIEKDLSVKHRNLYEANLKTGDMKTEAKEMFDELMKEENMTREKALDRIEKKLSIKHRNLYEASLKVGDMTTEAKEMYHELMKDENMTREIALTRIEKKLSIKHRRMYEKSLKNGDMRTEAMEMFDELMKEENMTREIALTRIEKKLSVKHRKLYEKSLKPEMDAEKCSQLIAQNNKQIQEREAKRLQKKPFETLEDRQNKLLIRANDSLAAGWTAHIDKKSGKIFYHNKEQNKSTWERLTATGWTAHIDKKSGKTFYYNKEQNKSTWALPKTNLPGLQSTSVTKATYNREKFTVKEDLLLGRHFAKMEESGH